MSWKTKFSISKIANRSSYEGNPLQIYEVESKQGEMISRSDMIKLVNEKFLPAFRHKYVDGLISITIRHPSRWFSSDATWLDEEPNYFTSDDYDDFDQDPDEYIAFRVSFMPMNHKHDEGGSDPHNDCLINCIKKFFYGNNSQWFFQAETLKERLKINRDDPINVDHMPQVEEYINEIITMGRNNKLDYAIRISGDAEYISPIQTNKIIQIVLNNGHYSIDSKFNKIRGRSYEERTIVMYEFTDDGINTFDGENETVISSKEFEAWYKVSSGKLLVSAKLFKKSILMSAIKRELTIVDLYYNYIEMADQMKAESNGLFNFYKTGSFKQMALNRFYDLTKAVQPEQITPNEAQWLHKASHGACTYWQKYKGIVHSYDVNSRYPHIMMKNFNYFPIKQGEFKSISYIKDKPDYGIYRCNISQPTNNTCKFFVFNKHDYYSHLDIEVAREYGLIVSLHEGQNFLYYSEEKRMNGAFLFQKYVKEIYELKVKKVKGAKDLLNVLWGALSETQIYDYRDKEDEDTNITEATIVKIHAGDTVKITCHHHKRHLFKSDWGRIKPFLLSYGRLTMFYRFRNIEDDIIRLHTDGIMLKEKNDSLQCGTKIGNLKYEGCYKVDIQGLNKLNKEKN